MSPFELLRDSDSSRGNGRPAGRGTELGNVDLRGVVPSTVAFGEPSEKATDISNRPFSVKRTPDLSPTNILWTTTEPPSSTAGIPRTRAYAATPGEKRLATQRGPRRRPRPLSR